jgi:hypothetical protein
MRSSQLTELRIFTEKLIEICTCGIPQDKRTPDGKLMNPAMQEKVLLVQSEQKRALDVVLNKIRQMEDMY